MQEEIGQDYFFGELFDLVMSKNPTADIWKDPEIVAFLQTKNLPTIDIDVNKSFEEAFRYGLNELEKARFKKHLKDYFKELKLSLRSIKGKSKA